MERPSESKTASNASSPKRLIVMCGLPGSGKTTTAHRIREALNDAFVFSRDHIRNPYRSKGQFDEYPNPEAKIADRIFYSYLEEMLPFFTTVILDATFKERTRRFEAFDFAQRHGCQFILIECICNYQILLKRLTHQFLQRQKNLLKPPKELLDYYIKKMQEPQDGLDGINFIRLNTEKNQILSTSLKNYDCQFTQYLIEILKQPFETSLSSTFGQLPLATEQRQKEYQKSSYLTVFEISPKERS